MLRTNKYDMISHRRKLISS